MTCLRLRVIDSTSATDNLSPTLALGDVLSQRGLAYQFSPFSSTATEPSYLRLLVVARGKGDVADASLEKLLILLHGPLKRYAFSKVRRSPDAEDLAADIAQDALIRIAKGVRSCRAGSDGEVVSWAISIAHRVVLDVVRSRQSGLQAMYFADVTAQAMFGMSMEDSVGQRAEMEPAMELLLSLMAEACNGAIDATGELLWWRLIVSLDWREIGERVDTTAAGAKRRFQRAIETLRVEIVRRIDALPSADHAAVLALFARFGYADVLLPDPPVSDGPLTDPGDAADTAPRSRSAVAFSRRVRASRRRSSSTEEGAVA